MANEDKKIGAKGYLLPAVVVAFTFVTIYTITVLIPDMKVMKSNPTKYAMEYVEKDASGNPIIDETGKPKLSAAGRGRAVYVREGCFYCHSQFVRPQDRDFGSRVHAGDYANETPNVLGTSRTGPDLSNEGGKLPDAWQVGHLKDPRAYTPGSIMPSFSFLSDEDLGDLVSYIQTLGRKRLDDPKNRGVYEAYYPEADTAFWKKSEHHKPNVDSAAAANGGAGIYRQNCAVCHGTNGLGNGPNALAMNKKPANFTRPFFKSYSDKTWYYKVAEGVPGTRMPRWKLALEPEQIWYLVAFLKTLPQDQEAIIQQYQSIDDKAWEGQSLLPPRLRAGYKKIGAKKLAGTYHPNPGGATGSELEGGGGGGH
ncbi:MAG: cbb3-type cytochrome c oxidase subunit II [Candidatus Melainabacteria bacterium]|nr:cbb3-type cytochrome c oxidase subunit II [Candidatus Melainabacteria bacterium]